VLKKVITYQDPFTDKPVSEEHYFHISKADLVEMEMEEHGAEYVKDGETYTGMRAKLQKIVDSNDGKAIMAEFKDIIRRSYGRKDGDRFRKSKEYWEDFAGSEAFSELLYELCTSADAASDFVNGIVPGNLEQLAAEAAAEAQAKTAIVAEALTGLEEKPAETLSERVEAATSEHPITLTEAELVEIDSDTLKSGIATGRIKLS
jgi:hypothetical protein